MLFPRLQPLVAVLGWDVLAGKTAIRRQLMQYLWTSKSQAFRLEDSSLYGNQSDEVKILDGLFQLARALSWILIDFLNALVISP